MKTIEEMGELARDTFYAHPRLHGSYDEAMKDVFIAVVKAVITAMCEDQVSWAPGDDEVTRPGS